MPSITERIKAFNADRDPVMMKSKYKAMMENPFRFFRGSCHIFYEDLAAGKLDITSPAAWICGDLHLENFGSYKSDNRLVYFDMNDFDEAILAPAHWEILRLVTSIFVAFESLEIEKKRAEKLARLYIRVYAETLKSGKAGYIERQTAEGIVSEFLAHAALKKRRQVLDKKTIKTRDRINLAVNIAKHEKLDYKLRKAIKQHMQEWLHHDENSPYNYHVIDCVFRKAGTGSLGLNRYVLLLKSSNKTGSKYILLDMKQVKGSSLAPYVNMPQPEWDPKATRVEGKSKVRLAMRSSRLRTSTRRKGGQLDIEVRFAWVQNRRSEVRRSSLYLTTLAMLLYKEIPTNGTV